MANFISGDQSADWAAFRAHLYQRTHPYLVRRYGQQYESLIADAVQDALVATWRKWHKEGVSSVDNWEAYAFQTVKFIFYAAYREARKREPAVDPADLPTQAAVEPPAATVQQQTFLQLNDPHLQQWYKRLPERHRLFVDLRCQGHNNKEVAELLGMSHGSARNLWSRLIKEAKGVMSR